MASSPKRTSPQRKRAPRGSISAEKVLKGAFALSRREGLDALTMPKLADSLEIGVTSLYWYFKSKDELFEAMSREAFSVFHDRMTIPAEGSWDERLIAYFQRFRQVLTEDPVLCDFVVLRIEYIRPDGVGRTLTNIEELVASLVDAGFDEVTAVQAYNSLSIYTRGSMFIDQTRLSHDQRLGFFGGLEKMQGLPAFEALPTLSAAIRGNQVTNDDEFEFGLRNAVRGLRTLLTSPD